jgi:hypothetical protein
MHGYGMKPADLAMVTIVAHNAMVNDRVPPGRRIQKMIIVLVDGVCRPGGDVNGTMPPPLDHGDLCEEGTFYANHPDGDAKAEDQLVELQTIVESAYRVKAAEDVMVTR